MHQLGHTAQFVSGHLISFELAVLIRDDCFATNRYANLPFNLRDRKREGADDFGMSAAIGACSSVARQSGSALRPGFHRHRAPLNILRSAREAMNVMVKTPCEIGASLMVRDGADGEI